MQAYDRRVSRESYTKLLMPNTVIRVVPYTNDSIYIGQTFGGDSNTCDWRSFVQNNPQLLYYPNGQANPDKNDPHGNAFPYDYQWGMWTVCSQTSIRRSFSRWRPMAVVQLRKSVAGWRWQAEQQYLAPA
ncbi:MAG: hypothetical protein JO028_05180 [Acidobacteriaceae bacterium]|nr:hypothetical protein [Acidobacteriaceae bacterium]